MDSIGRNLKETRTRVANEEHPARMGVWGDDPAGKDYGEPDDYGFVARNAAGNAGSAMLNIIRASQQATATPRYFRPHDPYGELPSMSRGARNVFESRKRQDAEPGQAGPPRRKWNSLRKLSEAMKQGWRPEDEQDNVGPQPAPLKEPEQHGSSSLSWAGRRLYGRAGRHISQEPVSPPSFHGLVQILTGVKTKQAGTNGFPPAYSQLSEGETFYAQTAPDSTSTQGEDTPSGDPPVSPVPYGSDTEEENQYVVPHDVLMKKWGVSDMEEYNRHLEIVDEFAREYHVPESFQDNTFKSKVYRGLEKNDPEIRHKIGVMWHLGYVDPTTIQNHYCPVKDFTTRK